jgi:hypothetical protein
VCAAHAFWAQTMAKMWFDAFHETELSSGTRTSALYVASNCNALSRRDKFIEQLMEAGVPIVARGKCVRNVAPIEVA